MPYILLKINISYIRNYFNEIFLVFHLPFLMLRTANISRFFEQIVLSRTTCWQAQWSSSALLKFKRFNYNIALLMYKSSFDPFQYAMMKNVQEINIISTTRNDPPPDLWIAKQNFVKKIVSTIDASSIRTMTR
jgi:hypothetical protein